MILEGFELGMDSSRITEAPFVIIQANFAFFDMMIMWPRLHTSKHITAYPHASFSLSKCQSIVTDYIIRNVYREGFDATAKPSRSAN